MLAENHRPALWLDLSHPAEVWRWITAHWLQTDAEHALWNGAALLILGLWIERFSAAMLCVGLLIGMAGVSLWFFTLNTLPLYCGLSGVLNTLLVMALVLTAGDAFRVNDTLTITMVILVALGAAAKIISELTIGAHWFTVGSWPAAPGAHAAGFATGLAWWTARWIRTRISARKVRWRLLKPAA